MSRFQNLSEFYSSRPLCVISLNEIADVNFRSLVERFSTDSCTHMSCPENSVLCKVLGKYLMWVDANDEGLAPHLVLQGYWEIWVTEALARHTKPNSIALDIGANVGYYTMLMADAVGAARRGQKVPEGHYSLERMLKRVTSSGEGRVLLCGTCMDARGMTDEDVMDGARRSTMDALAETTARAAKVLVF